MDLKEQIYNISKKSDISIYQKIQHFNLDLYYIKGIGIDRETNNLITYKINEFIFKYGNKFKSHTFILDYINDDISLMTYYFLSSISAISDFKFLVYSKKKVSLPENTKFIKSREIKRLKNVLYISTIHPISQVVRRQLKYKENITPLRGFLPIHLGTMAAFRNMNILLPAAALKFDEWVKFKNQIFNEDFDMKYKSDKIYLVYLTNDIAANQKILQNAQNEDCIIYYYWEEDNAEILRQVKEFSNFVKKKSNIYGYANDVKEGFNVFEIAKELNVKLVVNGEEMA